MADHVSIEEAASFATRLANASRAETLPRFRSGGTVFNKAGIWYDPVTDADREAERAQRRMINAFYPRHGIIGEEFGEENADAQDRWVLDPVDGTRAFVCGSPSWATLISFERDGAPIIGIIDQPFTDERWIGTPGGATYEHAGATTDAHVSDKTNIEKARLATTDPRRTAYFTAEEATAFERVADACQLTRFGMDAYAYALLAIGHIDLVIESGLQHHDFSALAPVVTGAGGVITNWSGDPLGDDDRGQVLAAATEALHGAAMELLRG